MVKSSDSTLSISAWTASPRTRGPTPSGVPGGEPPQPRGLGDDLGDIPDHVDQLGVLSDLAIDAQPDAAARRTLRNRSDGRNGSRLIEPLGGFPRLGLGLGGGLQITAGQIDADAVAEYQPESFGHRHIGPPRPERRHQFHLMVQIAGSPRIGDAASQRNDGVGGLGEEKRRIAIVTTHLAAVSGIVAAHAKNPPYWKRPLIVGDRHGGLGKDRNGP